MIFFNVVMVLGFVFFFAGPVVGAVSEGSAKKTAGETIGETAEKTAITDPTQTARRDPAVSVQPAHNESHSTNARRDPASKENPSQDEPHSTNARRDPANNENPSQDEPHSTNARRDPASKENPSEESELLQVQTAFPQYRVDFNHKVVQEEVYNELLKELKEKEETGD